MAKKSASNKSAPKKAAKRNVTSVDSIRHNDTRKNIPTEELRDFVSEEEHAPRALLYPRDPSLDPQLVWEGKDEQDSQDLSVPVVPIYIQEKIHPQALIDALPRIEKGGDEQLDLFADFNGLPEEFDQRIDFYQHDGHWSNRMILGDSLLVMTSLAEKEGLRGQVQTIYLDPPYGIKFGSNWQVSTRKRDVKDGKAEDATRQPEQVRAFRDTWKLGIHSYLAYLRDRLVAARELLTETGSVFVQIGDENVHLVRSVMDEVFGSECAVTTLLVKKKGGQKSDYIDPVNDYLLWYSKSSRYSKSGGPKFRALLVPRELDEDTVSEFRTVELPDGSVHKLSEVVVNGDLRDYRANPADLFRDLPGARLFRSWPITNGGERANQSGPLTWNGITHDPPKGRCWSHTIRTDDGSLPGMVRVAIAGRLISSGKAWDYKRYLDDFQFKEISNWWDGLGGASDPVYVVQTNPEIVKRCILMTTDPGDLVLDPTCGSGTTAFVAEQWGRRWITCDTSRVALALARTRLMAAKLPYYYAAEDYPQIGQNASDDEIKGWLRSATPAISGLNDPKKKPNVTKGFVYRRVSRVTSGSIANNPDICEGMSRAEVDAAVARHADTETLFDQPYEDRKRVRVSGPFTIESLSPHRTISVEEKCRRTENWEDCRNPKSYGTDDFATMIIDNLRKAGVQNTVKNERLQFESLGSYAGEWIHAEGNYSESDGSQRRAAVCIGPEHGTVGAQLVKEAAKEAVKGVGFDILIVCGFAFDPSVNEEAKRYGKLTVLPARINPDLAMGDELLKKTGTGNLFMVFGEPDIDVTKQKDGNLAVEIHGLDVYDPTTGEIRNSSTDDIACWFIDTAYNGESFFVRHSYFTGADEPYDKLKRALRAEIDEAAWSSLYSTTSRPFPRPDTGKIAVKVINHYGDEVVKVYEV